ncbi:MAG: FliM/FliN family flagellar motor switch protein [Planctomycetota bacterium]
MPAPIDTIHSLEVPIVVLLGERQMTVSGVLALSPGSIIELPKPAEDELDLLVNNRKIGRGAAVKLGENFGIRITAIGDEQERLDAVIDEDDEGLMSDSDAAALAEALLSGQ